jgi:hypothetical protein
MDVKNNNITSYTACLYVVSYITNTPVFNLAKIPIEPSIQSYHLFRKYRT